VGRGNQAEISAQGFQAADAAVGAGFQQAQQLDLERKRDVAHFVEEQGAPAHSFHQTGLLADRAGERAFFMAEHLALEQRLGQA